MSSELYEKNKLYFQVLRRENTRAQNDINVLSKMVMNFDISIECRVQSIQSSNQFTD